MRTARIIHFTAFILRKRSGNRSRSSYGVAAKSGSRGGFALIIVMTRNCSSTEVLENEPANDYGGSWTGEVTDAFYRRLTWLDCRKRLQRGFDNVVNFLRG